jgi:hypothetical protein
MNNANISVAEVRLTILVISTTLRSKLNSSINLLLRPTRHIHIRTRRNADLESEECNAPADSGDQDVMACLDSCVHYRRSVCRSSKVTWICNCQHASLKGLVRGTERGERRSNEPPSSNCSDGQSRYVNVLQMFWGGNDQFAFDCEVFGECTAYG